MVIRTLKLDRVGFLAKRISLFFFVCLLAYAFSNTSSVFAQPGGSTGGTPGGGPGGTTGTATVVLNVTPEGTGGCSTCGCSSRATLTCPAPDALLQNIVEVLPVVVRSESCSTCSGGSESPGSTDVDNGLKLALSHYGSAVDIRSSGGAGMFTNYDTSLKIYRLPVDPLAVPTKHVYKAVTLDPCTGTTQTFVNDGSSTFEVEDGSGYIPFVLETSSGVPLTNAEMEDLTDAVAVLIRQSDGTRITFDATNTTDENDGAVADYFDGRPMTITSSGGKEVNFTYLSDVRNDPNYPNDQESQLRFSTISDDYGVVATPAYAFVGGVWVWDSVDVAGYDTWGPITMDFAYSSSKLASVDRDGTNAVTYAYGNAPSSFGTGATTMTFENKLSQSPTRKSTIVYSGAYTGGGTATSNQYEGFVLGRQDGSGTTYSSITPDPANPNMYTLDYRGLEITWVPNQSIQYGNETTFPSVIAGGTVVGGTIATNGFTPPTTVDPTGYTTDHEYDSNGNRTKTIHHPGTAEETYELGLYDDNNLLVYFRDRAGCVTVYERDSVGRILRIIRGLMDDNDSVDDDGFMVPPGENPLQAIYSYGANGLVEWMHEGEYVPGPIQTPPANERYDFLYNANDRLAKEIKPRPHSQTVRPEVEYTWDGAQLTQMINERDYATDYFYDSLGRLVSTAYHDGSTEQVLYQDSVRRKYSKDRNGVVDRRDFDSSWRLRFHFKAYGHDASLLDGSVDTINPIHQYSRTNYSYTAGWTKPKYKNHDKKITAYLYDYRARLKRETRYPKLGGYRYRQHFYEDNLLFKTEERFAGYVRRTFHGYSTDRQAVRTITTRTASINFANLAAVMNATRLSPTAIKPSRVIHDVVRDVRGNIVQLFDPRNTETRFEYDCFSRMTQQTRAFGTSISLSTTYEYDADGNRTKTINPAGTEMTSVFGEAKDVISTTHGAGTGHALTTSYRYDADGFMFSRTEPSTAVTQTLRSDCCGRTIGVRDALGHGEIINQDVGGRTVHSVVVEDYDQHTDLHNPINGKTLGEMTARFFDNGQIQFQTDWKIPLGNVDPADPPIAGIGGVNVNNGVTTQYAYDTTIGDGIGLDSASGLTVERLGGGTATINISEALSKLAEPIANGGAAVTFTTSRGGSASVEISPDEKMVVVSISDGLDRTIMEAQLYGPAAASPNTLIDWDCTLHEKNFSLASFGTVEAVWAVDSDGKKVQSLTDGHGFHVGLIDQLNNVSKVWTGVDGKPRYAYDFKNQRTIYAYDMLGRETLMRNALNFNFHKRYDSAGRLNRTIDAKGKNAWTYFDALGRVVRERDRMARNTYRTYDSGGRLKTLKDGENRITTYSYDLLNRIVSTQLPDSSIRGMTYDAAGRVKEQTMHSGKIIKSTYHLTGQVEKKDYYEAGGSLSGTDTFQYDSIMRSIGSVSRDGVVLGTTYTERGQIEDESTQYQTSSFTVSHEYDSRGRVKETTYPSGKTVARSYDERSQIDTISWDNTQIEDRGYDANGQLASVARSFQTETRIYDAANRLLSIDSGSDDTAIYTYDANNNKVSETLSGPTSQFSFTTDSPGSPYPDGYDPEDRFMHFVQGDGTTSVANITFTRSLIGNISNINSDGTSVPRSLSTVHELETVGFDSQTFDDDGNLTTHYSGMSVGWDDGGLVETIDVNNTTLNGSIEYGYSADGKRVFKKTTALGGAADTTVFVHDGPNCVAEYEVGTSATLKQQYVYGDEIDSLAMIVRPDGQRLAVLRNQQWSVTALYDLDDNSAKERYAYDQFGNRTIMSPSGTTRDQSWFANPYGYTSRRHENDSGLMFFRARFYDPKTGEFLSRDPMEYVNGMSLYRGYFVPNGMDPEGLDWLDNCSNFFCGFADTLTCGGTKCLRECHGGDVHVDENSGCYAGGGWTGTAVECGIGGGIIKGGVKKTCKTVCKKRPKPPTPKPPTPKPPKPPKPKKPTKPKPPKCPPHVRAALRLAVENLCNKSTRPGGGIPGWLTKCTAQDGRTGAERQVMSGRWTACAGARKAYQKACFKKGDPGWDTHMDEINKAFKNAANCMTLSGYGP